MSKLVPVLSGVAAGCTRQVGGDGEVWVGHAWVGGADAFFSRCKVSYR